MYAQILRQHCGQSTVKNNPVDFNFQSSEIVGRVQRVIGKEWKASVEGLARVSALCTHNVSSQYVCMSNYDMLVEAKGQLCYSQ